MSLTVPSSSPHLHLQKRALQGSGLAVIIGLVVFIVGLTIVVGLALFLRRRNTRLKSSSRARNRGGFSRISQQDLIAQDHHHLSRILSRHDDSSPVGDVANSRRVYGQESANSAAVGESYDFPGYEDEGVPLVRREQGSIGSAHSGGIGAAMSSMGLTSGNMRESSASEEYDEWGVPQQLQQQDSNYQPYRIERSSNGEWNRVPASDATALPIPSTSGGLTRNPVNSSFVASIPRSHQPAYQQQAIQQQQYQSYDQSPHLSNVQYTAQGYENSGNVPNSAKADVEYFQPGVQSTISQQQQQQIQGVGAAQGKGNLDEMWETIRADVMNTSVTSANPNVQTPLQHPQQKQQLLQQQSVTIQQPQPSNLVYDRSQPQPSGGLQVVHRSSGSGLGTSVGNGIGSNIIYGNAVSMALHQSAQPSYASPTSAAMQPTSSFDGGQYQQHFAQAQQIYFNQHTQQVVPQVPQYAPSSSAGLGVGPGIGAMSAGYPSREAIITGYVPQHQQTQPIQRQVQLQPAPPQIQVSQQEFIAALHPPQQTAITPPAIQSQLPPPPPTVPSPPPPQFQDLPNTQPIAQSTQPERPPETIAPTPTPVASIQRSATPSIDTTLVNKADSQNLPTAAPFTSSSDGSSIFSPPVPGNGGNGSEEGGFNEADFWRSDRVVQTAKTPVSARGRGKRRHLVGQQVDKDGVPVRPPTGNGASTGGNIKGDIKSTPNVNDKEPIPVINVPMTATTAVPTSINPFNPSVPTSMPSPEVPIIPSEYTNPPPPPITPTHPSNRAFFSTGYPQEKDSAEQFYAALPPPPPIEDPGLGGSRVRKGSTDKVGGFFAYVPPDGAS